MGRSHSTNPSCRHRRLDAELPEVASTMGADAYCLAVETAKEYILSGDIFQVVLAQRFDFDLDAEPFDVYRVAAAGEPQPVHVLPSHR